MQTGALGEIVGEHLSRYPEMGIQDLYKLIYQGVMGSGHAVSSVESAGSWLAEEAASAGGPMPGETLVEEISPGGLVVRINLRPFIACGGSIEGLLRAFIRTGREFTGSIETLENRWEAATTLQERFPGECMREFMEVNRGKGHPAVHHSSSYRENYHPSYRVALRRICLEEGVLV